MKKLFIVLIVLAIALSVIVAFAASGNTAPADFTITTASGAELSLSSLLSQHDYVVLNIFRPELAVSSTELAWFEEMHKRLDDRVAIVAVTTASAETLPAYRDAMGLSFPAGASVDLSAYLHGKGTEIQTYPTTLVIDNQGSVVYTHSGYFRLQSQLQSVIDYFARTPGSKAAATYSVLVRDYMNQPVSGVVLNFYGAATSQMGVSDDNGVITFTAKPAEYHFQIISVPEGYAYDARFEGLASEWTVLEV